MLVLDSFSGKSELFLYFRGSTPTRGAHSAPSPLTVLLQNLEHLVSYLDRTFDLFNSNQTFIDSWCYSYRCGPLAYLFSNATSLVLTLWNFRRCQFLQRRYCVSSAVPQCHAGSLNWLLLLSFVYLLFAPRAWIAYSSASLFCLR